MAEFFALFFVSFVGAVAIACAINFFLRIGPWRAFGYGLFAVGIFLAFCASGLWENATKHDWGALTPVFAIFLIGGWCSLKFGKKIWDWSQKKMSRN